MIVRQSSRPECAGTLAHGLSALGWEAELRQLAPGREDLVVEVAAMDGVMLMRVDMNHRLHQLVMPPRGTATFGLPCGPQSFGRMGRRPLETDSLTLFDPRAGLDAVSEADFSAYTLSFDNAVLEEVAESTGLPDVASDPSLAGQQRQIQSNRLAPIRRLVADILAETAESDASIRANALRHARSELAMQVLTVFASSDPVPERASSRSWALKRALEYIEAHQLETISVDQLCRESAASISTLERAFGEYFGASPKRYLTAVRLNGVRRALLDPEEGRTVGDVATQWGFWHLSKFAADYKRMFGELPSQTLRRN